MNVRKPFFGTLIRDIRVSLFLTKRTFTHGNKGVLITPAAVMAVIFINLLFVPALIQGTINQNNTQLVDHLFGNFLVAPTGNTVDLAFGNKEEANLSQIDGVEAVTASYEAGYQVFKGAESGRWSVLAIDPASYYKVFNDDIASGSRLSSEDDRTGIVLGTLIAGNGRENSPTYQATLKGVTNGDTVTVKMSDGNTRDFTTRGIIDDHYFAANNRAFVSRKALQEVLPRTKDRAMTIYVKTDPKADQDIIREKLANAIPGSVVRSPEELSSLVQDTVGTIRTINKVISSLSLLVGAITIFIVTYVDLLTRRKQIGIERAVGIRSETIILTYAMKAVICTLIGILLGGLLFRFAVIPYFEHQPFNFPTGRVSLVFLPDSFISYTLTLIGVAIAAAIVPVMRSVRVKILDAIWG